MKYLRRELNQVEKEYVKQFGEDSLNRVILHDLIQRINKRCKILLIF